ncbi:MAG: dicarboxylate/amino acid:cation symporter [Rhodospirillaceae bacterium]|nr:dicarboxylate/amino acid:cation symporter [Rhodospirillaceae bacterium]
MSGRFTQFIIGAMLLGIITGTGAHYSLPPEGAKLVAGYFSVITDVFLRLIKMIIAPLVFTTLVSGIANMGRTSGDGTAPSLGRIGARTLGWFLSASLVSLLLGLIMVNLLRPGEGLNLPLPDGHEVLAVQGSGLNLKEFVTHLVPRSIAEAMAQNEILQIVVFSIFVGVACTAVGHHGKVVADFADSVANVMLRVTDYVMRAAPIAIFAAIAAAVTTKGLGILLTYGEFMGGFYLSLAILWVLLLLAGYAIIGPRIRRMISAIRAPVLLAFSTASSEAAYPRTLEQLERFGVSKRVASFVLPIGYSFNLDGSMMYCTFAVLFIAQAYGIEVSWTDQISMLLLLMITSKGMAGVPRASLVVIAATLTTFNLPEAGLLLILGVDQFLDMGRSATNVVGNAVATTVVAKWEKELQAEDLSNNPDNGVPEKA